MKCLSLLFLFIFMVNFEAHAKRTKYIRLTDSVVTRLPISPNGTVISFPTKPKKVILGRKDSFGIEYVENDIEISPLRSNSVSNLFVYLGGRRFTLQLYTSVNGHTLTIINDTKINQIKIPYSLVEKD